MYELRLEINLDIIKRDIEPETARLAIEKYIRDALDRHPAYIRLQTVLVVSPK